MEPKDLKKLYDDKKAAAAAKVATATAANTKAHDEINRKDIAGKTALRNVVLPYLTEVVHPSARANLWFNRSLHPNESSFWRIVPNRTGVRILNRSQRGKRKCYDQRFEN